MDRFKILLIAVLVFMFSLTCFFSESQSGQPGEADIEYTELLDKYEALKADRDNVLIQTRRLLQEKNDSLQLKESMEKFQEEKELLESERKELLNQNQRLKEELSMLQEAKLEIESERDQLREDYEKARKGTKVKELQKDLDALKKENKKIISSMEKEYNKLDKDFKQAQEKIDALKKHKDKAEEQKKTISNMQKEYKALNKDFKQAQKKIDALKKHNDKAEEEIAELRKEVSGLKKEYTEALKKNKGLAREIKDIPKKFSELARQNNALIKEGAERHYNLGVFYTKKKEYKQAISEFKKAVEINPDDAYAHFNLGYIYAEYLVNRKKAIEHFRHYLRLAKSDDNDVDWVRKYLLTWETYEGKAIMK